MEELQRFNSNEVYTTDVSLLSTYPPITHGPRTGSYISQFCLLLFSLVAHILAIVALRRGKQNRDMLDAASSENFVDVHTLLFKALLRIDLIATLCFICRGLLTPTSLFSENSFRCNFDNVSGIFFSWASGFINVLFFLERSLALRAPYAYRKYATPCKAKMAVISMVSLALCLSMLPVIGFGSYVVKVDGQVVCLFPGDVGLSPSKYHLHFAILYLTVGSSIVSCIVSGNFVVIFYLLRLRKVVPSMPSLQVPTDLSSGNNEGSAATCKENTRPSQAQSSQSSPQQNRDGVPRDHNLLSVRKNYQRIKIKIAVKFSKEVSTALVLTLISIAYMISWIPLYVSHFHLIRFLFLYSLTRKKQLSSHIIQN